MICDVCKMDHAGACKGRRMRVQWTEQVMSFGGPIMATPTESMIHIAKAHAWIEAESARALSEIQNSSATVPPHVIPCPP